MSEIVDKMRAVRAELTQRDRDEVAKRLAEYIYHNVESSSRYRECTAIFTRRSEIDACFDGTNKDAREWLFYQLKKDGLIETGEYSDSVWLTPNGAMKLCM